jgi:hypothetical protein
MTEAGPTSITFRVSILMSTRAGEDTTATMTGTDTRGIMIGSPMDSFNRTGKAGMITDIGRSKGPGEFRAINPDRNGSSRQ